MEKLKFENLPTLGALILIGIGIMVAMAIMIKRDTNSTRK
jgi:hypothetical protein